MLLGHSDVFFLNFLLLRESEREKVSHLPDRVLSCCDPLTLSLQPDGIMGAHRYALRFRLAQDLNPGLCDSSIMEQLPPACATTAGLDIFYEVSVHVSLHHFHLKERMKEGRKERNSILAFALTIKLACETFTILNGIISLICRELVLTLLSLLVHEGCISLLIYLLLFFSEDLFHSFSVES